MNDARYPNISAIDNRLAELENEKQQLLALREALRSVQNERTPVSPYRAQRTRRVHTLTTYQDGYKRCRTQRRHESCRMQER